MGTLFSFVDKMISSFAPMIAGLVFAACGFTDHNPSVGDIVHPQLRVGVVFLAYGDHHRFDLQPDCHEVLSAEQRKDGRDPG